ncbi:hypothetical protein HY031_00515 [Candidatus Gottesmanbacteria bacterium]|nr:hypothetical protein [Candidatus Gottesmanbacteria bacterium]
MKRIVFIIVGFLILLAIPVTVYLVSQRQEIRQKAAPATTLSLSPATVSAKAGDTFTLEVKIDTADNQVVASELHVTFDPNFLQAQSITNGALFPNILTSGVVESAAASIAVGAASSTQPVKGTGTAAIIRFKALAKTTTPTSVRFASTTFVGGLGESSTNVLVGTSPAQVTISDAAGATTSAQTSTGSASLSQNPALSLGNTSSSSAQASSSAVTITSPAQSSAATSSQPMITGKAPPGSVVTIVIHSTGTITATVTADANGNWSYTPTTPLDPGSHSVVASATNPATGQVQTSTIPFVVASGGAGSGSQSAIPVTGAVENTIILLSISLLMLLGGLLLPALAR